MAATPNILNLIRTDNQGNPTEDLTGGVLPVVDGSNLTGVIGNTYIAAVDPGANDDGYSNSLTFSGVLFQIGQQWYNYTTEKLFHCVNNDAGKARWNENLQGFGSNFTFLGGSLATPRGSVVRLDNSGSGPGKAVIIAAVDGDDSLVGVTATDVSGSQDMTVQVVSAGTVKVRVDNLEPNWVRGDAIYLSTVAGLATNVPTTRLIGYAAKAATTGTVLRDLFVGFGSGGGGGGDLHTVTQNKKLIDQDYSLDPNYNGVIAGPVTVDVGVTLTVPLNSRLVIV